MADDLEKKPKVILNKQKKSEPGAESPVSASEQPEKKKEVVVKKKPAPSAAPSSEDGE